MSNTPPSITPSWTFTVWLAFQEQRKDKVGELARAVRNNPSWPGWRNIEGLEAYCRQQKFSPGLIAALKQAWESWEAAKRASEGALSTVRHQYATGLQAEKA